MAKVTYLLVLKYTDFNKKNPSCIKKKENSNSDPWPGIFQNDKVHLENFLPFQKQ